MINILGKTKTTRLVSLVVIAILLAWIIYGFVVIYTLPDWPERGTFGLFDDLALIELEKFERYLGWGEATL